MFRLGRADERAPKNFGGLDASVVFVDTEQTFSSNRLAEIAKKRFPEIYDKDYYKDGNNNDSVSNFGGMDKDAEMRLEKLLAEKVFVVTPQSLQELKVRIENLKPALTQSDAKLIVIDSVARLARAEGGIGAGSSSSESLVKRQNILSSIAAALKRHAEQLNVAVVVTNQVTTNTNINSNYHNSNDPAKANMVSRDSQVAAALGTKWAHCVQCAHKYERCNRRESGREEGDEGSQKSTNGSESIFVSHNCIWVCIN